VLAGHCVAYFSVRHVFFLEKGGLQPSFGSPRTGVWITVKGLRLAGKFPTAAPYGWACSLRSSLLSPLRRYDKWPLVAAL